MYVSKKSNSKRLTRGNQPKITEQNEAIPHPTKHTIDEKNQAHETEYQEPGKQ